MRKDAKTMNEVIIPTLSGYHGSHFDKLRVFNSDRTILLNDDYSISEDNTESIKRFCKVGEHMDVFGLEVETVNGYCNNSTINVNLLSTVFEKLFDNDLFRCERDGSLPAGRGVECISQTMTKAYVRNNYKNFKSLWDEYFPSFGITTENEWCGMHVSIDSHMLGKDKDERVDNAKKLYYLINKHYEFFKVAFNRVNDTTYCGKCRDWRSIKNVNWDEYYFPNDHYQCMNYSHARSGRLEIRLVGGQKNFACFRNTMEVIFHITSSIKKLSWNDLDDLSKVFKGCNQYTYDRLTKCRTKGVLNQDTLDKIESTVKRVDW